MQALSIEANKVLNNIFAPYPRSLFPYFGSKLSVSTGERLYFSYWHNNSCHTMFPNRHANVGLLPRPILGSFMNFRTIPIKE